MSTHKLFLQAVIIAVGCAVLTPPVLAVESPEERNMREVMSSERKREEEKEQKEREEQSERWRAEAAALKEQERLQAERRLEADPQWQAEQRKKEEELRRQKEEQGRQKEEQGLQEEKRERQAQGTKMLEAERVGKANRDEFFYKLGHDPSFAMHEVGNLIIGGGSHSYLGLIGDERTLLNEWGNMNIAEAQYRLGLLYADGRLFLSSIREDVDFATAVEWYGKAARAGHASAKYRLGLAYLKGSGVPQDLVQARHLFLSAATDKITVGGCLASIELARLYDQGLGVQPDSDRAHMWLLKASASKPRDFRSDELTVIPNQRELIGKLTDAQLAKACALLGDAYGNGGEGLSRDAKLAYGWYVLAEYFNFGSESYAAAREAAARNLSRDELLATQVSLGEGFELGRPLGIRLQRSIRTQQGAMICYRGAACLGNSEAQRRLAVSYDYQLRANGGTADLVSAYAWYVISGSPADCDRIGPRLSQDQLARAQFMVAKIYGSELEAPKPDLAEKWLKLATENGNAGRQ